MIRHRTWLAYVIGAALALPAALAAQTTTVVLVRHAEKAAAPADDPPLSDAGQARAKALAAALANYPVDVILVTPFARTRQTAAPVAELHKLTPVEVPNAGSLADRVNGVAKLIREQYAGKRVLVVGHSNTIPAIVGALGGPQMAAFCEPTEYSNLLVMELAPSAPPKLIRGMFGAPDAPMPASCAGTMR